VKILLLAALFAVASMTAGHYEVAIDGMLCHACAKAIAEQVSALGEVEKASVDFDTATLLVTVKAGSKLNPSKLNRALRRASERVNLGQELKAAAIRHKA
jgi:cation transport ATPase